MKNKGNKGIKIRWMRIVDYKGIDKLGIEFPRPKMAGNLDVAVMGSRNGLEFATALLFFSFGFSTCNVGARYFISPMRDKIKKQMVKMNTSIIAAIMTGLKTIFPVLFYGMNR